MEFITLFGTPKKKEPTVFEKIKAAVQQTKQNFTEQIQDLVEGQKEIDANMLEQLEAIMIGADIGVATTNDILKTINDRKTSEPLSGRREEGHAMRCRHIPRRRYRTVGDLGQSCKRDAGEAETECGPVRCALRRAAVCKSEEHRLRDRRYGGPAPHE